MIAQQGHNFFQFTETQFWNATGLGLTFDVNPPDQIACNSQGLYALLGLELEKKNHSVSMNHQGVAVPEELEARRERCLSWCPSQSTLLHWRAIYRTACLCARVNADDQSSLLQCRAALGFENLPKSRILARPHENM